MSLLVCIDESGCTGFKLEKGSSPYFVVAMVIFRDFEEAEKCSRCIAELRGRLNINSEFKFNKSHPNVKESFFISVKKFNFSIRALVVDKRQLYSSHLRKNKDSFYNYFMHMLMKHDEKVLQGANIKVDGSGSQVFKQELSRYLRQYLGPKKIAKFRFADSKNDDLIQLADMVVGAIARSYNDSRKDSRRWRTMLEPKIEDVWEFCRPCTLV